MIGLLRWVRLGWIDLLTGMTAETVLAIAEHEQVGEGDLLIVRILRLREALLRLGLVMVGGGSSDE